MILTIAAIRRRFVPCCAVCALVTALVLLPSLASPQAAAGKPITIKMATLVPSNSSWFLVLKEVAEQWDKLSDGRVKITLYGGGTKGDDPEVVQAMRLGELQGAVLTSVGLAEIERSVYAVSIPMAYDSYEEVYAVLDKVRPRLDTAMEAAGFVVLNWADAGWVHFFTTKPVAAPDDLKKLKLFQWNGDPKSLEIWKIAGFNPRPASSTDLLTGLSTGLFEACSMSPQVAQIGRYYEKAKYMTDLNWALLMGATVVKKETWNQDPRRHQARAAQGDAGCRRQAPGGDPPERRDGRRGHEERRVDGRAGGRQDQGPVAQDGRERLREGPRRLRARRRVRRGHESQGRVPEAASGACAEEVAEHS